MFLVRGVMMAQKKILKDFASPVFTEGGGFKVRRPLGIDVADCDPLLMLDHLGPINNAPGKALGAPDHPHRGFEAVMYLVQGGILHHDSLGNGGRLDAGGIQWMTAGSGLVHAEMPVPEMLRDGGIMEGFQLWVNLPAKDKMIPPRYQDLTRDMIPIVQLDNGSFVRVIAGEFRGVKSNIETHIPINHLNFELQPSGTVEVTIPAAHNILVYCWRGNGELKADKSVKMDLGKVVYLAREGEVFTLSADATSVAHYLVISGVPIDEPVVRRRGFVMNTEAEVLQAIDDYETGKLGTIAGAKERFAETAAAKGGK